jgi:Fe-S-cluster containining protein
MPNAFERELGIPLPKCCSTGACCKGASPSTPYHQLMKRAAEGDEFAQGFFSIMIPYASHADAEAVVPGLVERTIKAAQKQPDVFQNVETDLVFYQCRYLTSDNKCGVWEDRPQFCRDYPDTPFVVMAPGCAFESWGEACKKKYNAMKAEVEQLKALKEELAALKAIQNPFGQSASQLGKPHGQMPPGMHSVPAQPALHLSGQVISQANGSDTPYGDVHTKIDAHCCASHNTDNLSLVLSLTSLYVASPLRAFPTIRI